MADAPRALTFGSGDVEVIVLPDLGARLHRLSYRGVDLLRTPADIEEHRRDPFFYGAYVMAPWCNRLAPGLLAIAGRTIDLATNFSDGSAIHGEVYLARWQVDQDELFIEAGDAGWPWRYRTSLQVTVEGTTIRIAQSLSNLDNGPMPGGIGLHPWWAGQPEVAIHAERVFSPNVASPAAPIPVEGELDRRSLAPMAVGVDAAWPLDGSPAATLYWPNTGIRATIEVEPADSYVVAANPGNRNAIALEPETHAPMGLRRWLNGEPGAMTLIEPGASLSLVTTVRLSIG
jgi:aldose 1-epimerase